MPTTKNALTRYKILDNCFRNSGRNYFINDLIEECNKVLCEIDPESKGISRRQIFDDIAFMESSEGWNIELNRIREGKRMFYRYADTSFSINNMPLNEIEINHLKSAINILTQFKGMPQFEWMHELVPKLKQGMGDDEVLPVIIEFDSNQYLKGIEYLGILYNAIYYKKVLFVKYQPFEANEPQNVVIHPYFLKQYNNRWFLFGYNPEFKKYDWNLALDRMITIKEADFEYHENDAIKWGEYFEDIIGVTMPEKARLESVVLHFYGKTGKYIESKPIHGSQKSRWIDKNTLEVKLQLFINYELERLIWSYVDTVKVIQPKILKEIIHKKIVDAGKLYLVN